MSAVKQPMPISLLTRWIKSPIGLIEIGINTKDEKGDASLWYVELIAKEQIKNLHNDDKHPLLDLAQTQLDCYFKGQSYNFDLLLEFQSSYGTKFQKQVWHALTKIPLGETWSYGQLAAFINNPKAVRAVGAANGKNPLAIVVPCHRVIGANGTLTGYAGGLDNKQKLLDFEKSLVR